MTIDLPTAYRPGPFVLRATVDRVNVPCYVPSVEESSDRRLLDFTIDPAKARKFSTAADAADYAHARAGRFAGCVLAVVPADEAKGETTCPMTPSPAPTAMP